MKRTAEILLLIIFGRIEEAERTAEIPPLFNFGRIEKEECKIFIKNLKKVLAFRI